jgi:hypothetical protein
MKHYTRMVAPNAALTGVNFPNFPARAAPDHGKERDPRTLCCELITVNAAPLRLANILCVIAATPPAARVGRGIRSLENAEWL